VAKNKLGKRMKKVEKDFNKAVDNIKEGANNVVDYIKDKTK